jgi:hypothetical protein
LTIFGSWVGKLFAKQFRVSGLSLFLIRDKKH